MQYDALQYIVDLHGTPADVWKEYSLVYYGAWSTFEEHGSLLILKKDDQYLSLEGGHCVMADDNRDETWGDIIPITKAVAIIAVKEIEESFAENSQHHYC